MITSLVLIEESETNITVAVYINYLYDRRETISKDKFPKDTLFYSGMAVNKELLN